MQTEVQPTKRDARIAGAFYLTLMTAPFSLIYVPNKLIVRGDAAATAAKILGHEMMFRLSIVNELFGAAMMLFLVFALYRLLSGVNKTHARLMVILGAFLTIPISFLNVVNEIAALTLLRGPAFLSSVFNRPQLEALALLFLGLYSAGLVVVQIFWGLWPVPFGLLVMRSGFIPRILGILLIVNGFAYVLTSATVLLFPAYGGVVSQVMLIPETGELWIMLWLLIVGVKVPRLPEPVLA